MSNQRHILERAARLLEQHKIATSNVQALEAEADTVRAQHIERVENAEYEAIRQIFLKKVS